MDLPTRKKNRLPDYDYGQCGVYFITICTRDKQYLLWNPVGATIGRPLLSDAGKMVETAIKQIPKRYPEISVDHFAIMPNHVHLLVRAESAEHISISRVVQQFKGAVSKTAGNPLWQKSFYDHVVRNERDYQEIWMYIENNPLRWMEDELYQDAGIR